MIQYQPRLIGAIAACFICLVLASGAFAQLAEFQWQPELTGAQQWQVPANWTPPEFPDGYPYPIPNFPNDPDRMDEDATVIWPVIGANLSVPLVDDLTVDVGATDVAIASLVLGGTAGTVTTDISSSGGRLVFDHGELNDFSDLMNPICSFNCGNVRIVSGGTAGATNVISAPIHVSGEAVQFAATSTNDLVLAGDLTFTGGGSALQSFMPAGRKVTVSGDISLVNTDDGMGAFLNLNTSNTNLGVLEITGVISDGGLGGGVTIGVGAGDALDPLSTVILSGSNTFSGQANLGRATVVLANDNALGQGTIEFFGVANEFGRNIVSDNDSRTIANEIELNQYATFAGDHSLTLTGMIIQRNTRGMINALAAGTTLTLTGPIYPNLESEMPPEPGRRLIIDGGGKTVITGGFHDQLDDDPEAALDRLGSLTKRGTGTLVFAFDDANAPDTPTDFGGYVYLESGNLHFAANRDLPDPAENVFGDRGEIVSSGGAVGVDAGVLGNSDFLVQLNNSSNPNHDATTPPFFRRFDTNDPIPHRFDHGGLMLGTDEYDADLDFNSGDLAGAANMTLAAHETGSAYTGTITPSTTVARDPNTYQLGGGSGTLSLPNANQLTGDRDLLATNGGEIKLDNTNNYTGTTTVHGKFHASFQEAEANRLTTGSSQFFVGTTLTVTTLADGGQDSSIGNSNSDAGNLVVQGSTLKYIGGGASTDRLFTLGTAGGSIDSSGDGPLNFTNSAPLAVDVAEDREAIASSAVPGAPSIFGIPTFNGDDGPVLFNTRDLVPGMAVSVAGSEESAADPFNLLGDPETEGIGDDLIITGVIGPDFITVGEEAIDQNGPGPDDDEIPWGGFGTTYPHVRYDFGPAPARNLTLTGDNMGDNTLSAQITDAADRDELDARGESAGGPGGKGSVGVIKSGPGKWILANENNNYTGETMVEEGILAGLSIGTGPTADLIVEEGGTISPGLSVHTLTVGGLYNQAAGGTYLVEIAGSDPGQYDVLDVQGDPDEPEPEPGDYNEDGAVNAADYAVWRNLNGQNVTLPNEDPDAETPGIVDEEDYDFWVDNFGDSNVGQRASAVIEGTILIDLLSFEPTVGDMFTILTANSVIAGNLTLSGESTGFELIVNPMNLTLAFTGAGAGASAVVPEPSSCLLALFACVFFARRRTRT